jgi:ATP-dependent helicase HrpA
MPDATATQSSAVADVADLRERLRGLTLSDAARLGSRLHRTRSQRDAGRRARDLAKITSDIETAEVRVELREQARPTSIGYPSELPVAQRADDIADAIRDHQVIVLAGATGSGKTTQLPKICLDLGRGVRGMIGHTQPRRIAARSVAERIAEELDTPLGGVVGYQMRFADHTSDDTLVKVMTDGVLLAEIAHDRDLLRYDTIIVDEAHERSLNIDFLLGYLTRLLPRRPDLKVIITSATIDPQRFSRHFGGAPIIEVSGRTFPVEMRYRPLPGEDDGADDERDPDDPPPPPQQRRTPPASTGTARGDDARDQITAICDAIDELRHDGRGDILVFCSGEREIRDTADAVKAMMLPDTEILPLFARLSAAEQHRVFAAHTGRRIVLATNVAETSITVPGIRYVIDPGTARISRYSRRLKVQRLPIEAISQASANQRAGRCGRVADGICIRLYSEEDYLARPEFTDPEILRTSLASVILQMAALGLGEMADFPFVEPPDARTVNDGVRLLEELGAFRPDSTPTGGRKLTQIGRSLAQLPLDPRLARMVIAADELGCLREVLVVVAGLTIADPRERPVEKREAADSFHRRFRVNAATESDFLSLLNLWTYVREQRKELSSSAFRRMCGKEYLHYLRIREWQDLEAQLRTTCGQLGLHVSAGPVEPDPLANAIHQAMLTGLLSHVGLRDQERREYLGARGAWFSLSPGTVLFKSQPAWVMAAELVETTRLWAHTAAKIDPAWIEASAGHLLRRSYSEPHWEKKAAAVVAFERVTLYGIPVVTQRKITYGSIDPVVSRELFIRHALVDGDWDTRHEFFHRNRALLDEVADLEDRARRRDLLVDDETLVAFYDERIPAEVVSGRHFDSWWKKARRDDPDLLTYTEDLLVDPDAAGVVGADYPTTWTANGIDLDVTYQFEPGTAADGVTVHVPLAVLNQLTPDPFGWQIPGLRTELVTALVKALPKNLRRLFVPAPDTAAQIVRDGLDPADGPITAVLARVLSRRAGEAVVPRDFDPARVPDRLRVTFSVHDARGRELRSGKDLAALQRELAPQLRKALGSAGGGIERSGLTSWSFGELPATISEPARSGGSGVRVTGYPALVDDGDSVSIRVFESTAEQQRATWAGQRRLLTLGIPSPVRPVLARLDNTAKLALGRSPYPDATAMFDDAVRAAIEDGMRRHGAPATDEKAFAALRDAVRADLADVVGDVLSTAATVLGTAHGLRADLAEPGSRITQPSLDDMSHQLEQLVGAGFIGRAGRARLHDVVRYLRAIRQRLDKLAGSAGRDLVRLETIRRVEDDYRRLVADVPSGRARPPSLDEIFWLLQDWRVLEFAQNLRGPQPVSEKRIRNALAAARRDIDALR